MSLSKNIKHYRRAVRISNSRTFTDSSNAVGPPKMSTRTMTLSQWKIFNQLRDYLGKYTQSGEKGMQTLNREFAQLLQKIQPSVYGSVRFFDSAVIDPKTEKKSEVGGFGHVFNGLKLKMSKEDVIKVPAVKDMLKWKIETSVSKTGILSRTNHIIHAIATAENEVAQLKQIEDLSLHLQKFPEATHNAVKEGAIRLMLRLKSTPNLHFRPAIDEVLALLGHVNPPNGHGIRILAIDGGGVRGILVIEMLRKLEELTGKRVYEMFDYICGVSTGAILACTLGALQKTCDQLHKDYLEISTKIFTQSTIKGTSSLVWSHSYYDTELWERLLRQQMGESSLIATNRNLNCPKMSTVSAIVNHDRVSAYVFRNYSLPWRVRSQYMGGTGYKVWEATRASAAAPTYFEECKLGNLLHQDGGILFNNPTAVAIHEAKLLWPDSPIQCVVSFGTGRTNTAVTDTPPEQPANVSSWKNKFMKILDSATDTEGVHTMLSDLLPTNVYFRFNPYLTEMLSMVEIDPQKLEQLERDAVMYLRRNDDKFQQAAKVLMQPRTITQRTVDYVKLKREMLGLSSKL